MARRIILGAIRSLLEFAMTPPALYAAPWVDLLPGSPTDRYLSFIAASRSRGGQFPADTGELPPVPGPAGEETPGQERERPTVRLFPFLVRARRAARR